MNTKRTVLKSLLLATTLALPIEFINAQNQKIESSLIKNNGFELRIDKNMTDEQLKKDENDAKQFDFQVAFTGVKRNDKKEITTIKIAYNDKEGNSGNYNVVSNNPISVISIKKVYDRSGKGVINIQNGTSAMDAFAWNSMPMGSQFNDDRFQQFFNGEELGGMDLNLKELDLDRLKELNKEFMDNSENGFQSKSFIFKDGKMLNENPDMKLEEEKTEEDGTITKKYSDGNGNTMIFKEKKWNGTYNNEFNQLDDLKKEKKIEKSIIIKEKNDDLEKIKSDLEKTKIELEKLKTDLQKDKGSKGNK